MSTQNSGGSKGSSRSRRKVQSDQQVWKRLSRTVVARLRLPDADLTGAGAMDGLLEGAHLESFAAWYSYMPADLFECALADDAAAGVDVERDLASSIPTPESPPASGCAAPSPRMAGKPY